MNDKQPGGRLLSRRSMLGWGAGVLGSTAFLSRSSFAQNAAGAAVDKYNPNPHLAAPGWLARRQEEAIEPELEIVDSHHHLWDRTGDRFLFDELLALTKSGHKITHTVFCECGSMYRSAGPAEMKVVGETEFVNGIAAMSASGQYGPARLCAAIIGLAELRLGDGVAKVLEAQIAAGDGRFRGIRWDLAWDESPSIPKVRTNPKKGDMEDTTWRAGFARLAPLDLTFDAYIYHPQLPQLTALARAFPKTTIILDHVGTPIGVGPYKDKKEETFKQWKANIIELAESENVVVKLGGLGMGHGMFDFYNLTVPPSSQDLAESYKPYIETCIEAFGPNRCMFESNFTPDQTSGPYPVVWNAFKRLAASYSPTEKQMMFSGTAKRIYRLT